MLDTFLSASFALVKFIAPNKHIWAFTVIPCQFSLCDLPYPNFNDAWENSKWVFDENISPNSKKEKTGETSHLALRHCALIEVKNIH